jgi:hypothetical protein
MVSSLEALTRHVNFNEFAFTGETVFSVRNIQGQSSIRKYIQHLCNEISEYAPFLQYPRS